MPGGRGKVRKKNKRQDRDVSFRFHSGGSVGSAAYLSEGSRDSPVFSDSLDEQEEVAEDSKHASTLHTDNIVTSDTEDQNLVRELLESAIDDTNGDGTHFDPPHSDPLFEFEQEPLTHQEPEKSEAPEKGNSTKSNPTKGLEYSETIDADEQPLADSEGFSDSGDFMSIKEKLVSGIESKPTEIDRLLDSGDEELFLSMTKETIASVNETIDDKGTTEIDYTDTRSHELESDNDLAPVTVSPFKGNASTGEDAEDTLLAEADTHPLIRTASADDIIDGGEIKEDLQSDEHNYQLLLSEEHFSNITGLVEPPKKDDNFKVKPKRPPPPRPPLPSKIGRPNIVVSAPTNDLTPRTTECNNNNGVMVKPEPFHELALSSAEADEENAHLVQLVEGSRSSEAVRDDSLSLLYFVIYTIVVFLYYSLNPSSYLAGFLTGFLFFFVTTAVGFIWYVNYLLSVQQKEREAVEKSLELSNQQLIDHLDDQPYFKKTSKFGIRFAYNPATHHYSDNTPAHVKLEGFILTFSIKRSSDSEDHAQQNSQTQDSAPQYVSSEIVKHLDLRECSITLVPDEVARNRKRRWSKKFPVCISHEQSHQKNRSFYLFTPTAKVKEMWFRRLKLCSEGNTDEDIALKQNKFYSHMKHYMPKSTTDTEKLKPEKKKKRKKGDNSSVHYSMKSQEESDEEEENSAVSITKQATSVKAGAAKKSAIPPAMADMDWLNTALARVCWDIWHEKRWHNWVEERIKRRISRIKTPSWMEPLSVADVQLGKDIPIVKRIYAPPKLNSEGVWIYLAVQYKGSFTMTLETKLRLGKKDETDSQQQPHVISGHPSTGPKKPFDRYAGNQRDNSGDEQPTLIHKRSMPRSISSSSSISSQRAGVISNTGSVNADSDLDSGSDDEMSASSSLSSSPNISQLDSSEIANVTASISAQASYPSRPAKWKNMLDRFKNSTIVQKAANTRIVRMAAEKMSSYNLYLTVEVKALDGFLAVNMSPPPSDILWYGFQWKPRLDLSAKPKLGQREVTLHYVTEWIENKLKELLEKQMVLPNMESIAIPIMNSGISGDVPYKLPKLSSNPKE